MAYLAYLIADWQDVGFKGTLVMVWAGSVVLRNGIDLLKSGKVEEA